MVSIMIGTQRSTRVLPCSRPLRAPKMHPSTSTLDTSMKRTRDAAPSRGVQTREPKRPVPRERAHAADRAETCLVPAMIVDRIRSTRPQE